MRKRAKEARVARPVRHGIAAIIFWLLPLLAFAGMLAPGYVKVQYEEQEESTTAKSHGSVVFHPVPLSRPPLMIVPRDPSTGFVPEMLDLESLFSGTRYRGESGHRLASLPSFPSHEGDMIVIDDVDTFVADQIFKDLLKPSFVATRGVIWDPSLFDVIPPLFPIGNNSRYDDFPEPGLTPSNGTVVPEPATGLLVSVGLVALGWSRRRRPGAALPV